jgi:hypothetical protein
VRKTYSFCTPEIGIHKPLILLIVACEILRGFFHTNRLIVVFDRYRRRRRQLLWCHTLDLMMPVWSTARFIGGERRGTSPSDVVTYWRTAQVVYSSKFLISFGWVPTLPRWEAYGKHQAAPGQRCRQLLGPLALGLTMPVRMHNDALERDHRALAAVRIRGSEGCGQRGVTADHLYGRCLRGSGGDGVDQSKRWSAVER